MYSTCDMQYHKMLWTCIFCRLLKSTCDSMCLIIYIKQHVQNMKLGSPLHFIICYQVHFTFLSWIPVIEYSNLCKCIFPRKLSTWYFQLYLIACFKKQIQVYFQVHLQSVHSSILPCRLSSILPSMLSGMILIALKDIWSADMTLHSQESMRDPLRHTLKYSLKYSPD